MQTQEKLYPVGIQHFSVIREENYAYVDKTALIYKLTHSSYKFIFLSRPRRFGKSLLIDTLRQYFLGKKELFNGLAIEKMETEWTEHPVFHVDFSVCKYCSTNDLHSRLNTILEPFENLYGKKEVEKSYADRFAGVIKRAYELTGNKAVVLIDEYDSPLLDTNIEPELQSELRNIMRNFFSPLKHCGEFLRFVMLTGITKFSQLSIFSELNNLANISMTDEYAAICGISKEELLTQMKPDIELMAKANNETYDEACANLKKMYDGYHFSKNSPDIYNPFSLVRAFANKEYGNYWFESGTPTFLVELLRKKHFDVNKLEKMTAMAEDFDRPTDRISNPVPVLYQSGYLTIKGYNPERKRFTLGYPNNEVRFGFLKMLLPNFVRRDEVDNSFYIDAFIDDLDEDNIDQCMKRMKAFFAKVPNRLENKTEKHFQTMFYILFTLMGENIHAEHETADGRVDAVVWRKNGIFVFEFKYNGSAQAALDQINTKDYAVPFTADGRKIYKIGVNFSGEKRTITEWLVQC